MEKSLQKLTLTDRRKLEVGTAFSENGTVEITGYIRTIHFCDGRYADNFISRIFR